MSPHNGRGGICIEMLLMGRGSGCIYLHSLIRYNFNYEKWGEMCVCLHFISTSGSSPADDSNKLLVFYAQYRRISTKTMCANILLLHITL